jgi:tetratricopeptide (TPR) repeat protein
MSEASTSHGGEAVVAGDTRRHHGMALVAYREGAYASAVAECLLVLDGLRSAPLAEESDRLRVSVIDLLLDASALWWQGRPDRDQRLPIRALLREAEDAARRVGDVRLLARVKYRHGQSLVITDGLDAAIAELENAVALARQAGNVYDEILALTELGHHSVGKNLPQGLTMLREAHALFERHTSSLRDGPDAAMADVHRHRLQGLIGVVEFDRGQFDEAERWLRRSMDGLQRLNATPLIVLMANFLGQMLIAAGRFEDAEEVLQAAIRRLRDEREANSYQGYNLALLGKLYLEWDRIADAEAPMLEGWRQTQEARPAAILPLVRNYYSELLMHPRYRHHDPQAAELLLAETVKECAHTGFQRSAIAALSLAARLALAQGEVAGAVELSGRAVAHLEKVGTMPSLRTEEVYLVQYEVLTAASDQAQARQWLERAAEVLTEKAASIGDPDRAAMFLERVPTSRAIVAAWASSR